MARSKSSKRWLQEHFEDNYVKKAQASGYRSRSVYKLMEIDEKEKLLKPGMTVVDLGAAPGGWTQYVTQKLNGHGIIIALDCLKMDALPDVQVIQGDFRESSVLEELLNQLKGKAVDMVLSDMAPNMSGSAAIDIPKAMYLAELVLDFCVKTLKPGGSLLMKVFHGVGFDDLVRETRSLFGKVGVRKPAASRSRSRETYLLAKNYNL